MGQGHARTDQGGGIEERRGFGGRLERAACAAAIALAGISFARSASAAKVVFLQGGSGASPLLVICDANPRQPFNTLCENHAAGVFLGALDVGVGDFGGSGDEMGVLMRHDGTVSGDLIVRAIGLDSTVSFDDLALEEPPRSVPVEYVDLSFGRIAALNAAPVVVTHRGELGNELLADVYAQDGSYQLTIALPEIEDFAAISLGQDDSTFEEEFFVLHGDATGDRLEATVVAADGSVTRTIELNLPLEVTQVAGFSIQNLHGPLDPQPTLIVHSMFGGSDALLLFDRDGQFVTEFPSVLPSNPTRNRVGIAAFPCTKCVDGSVCLSDKDADGLFDVWELDGVDVDCDSAIDLDLSAMGADPEHKDVFVEYDWTVDGTQPTQSMIRVAKTTFAAAPVSVSGVRNPDNLPGIRLWVDTGAAMDPFGIEPNRAASCSDGVDNEGDGLADMADPDCQWNYGLEGVGACNDGIDNDNDGVVDGGDGDCDPRRNREDIFGLGGSCGDGIDNDLDGFTDLADTKCSGGALLPEGAGRCNDGIDNDADGLVDASGGDLDCLVGDNFGAGGPIDLTTLPAGGIPTLDANFYAVKAANFDRNLRNQVFHYAVGSLGFDVRQGESGAVGEGSTAPLSCQDGIDNDGNGATDYQDATCRQCNNGVDDDGDGQTDRGDSSCVGFAGGVGELGGNDFVLYRQGGGHQLNQPWNTGTDPTTFVHELGHNLNLGHGGNVLGTPDNRNCKPHYVSAMNYSYSAVGILQLAGRQSQDTNRDGLVGNDGSLVDFWPPRHLDVAGNILHSDFQATLVENALNESVLVDSTDTNNAMSFVDPVTNTFTTKIGVGGTDVTADGIRDTDWNNDAALATISFDIDSDGLLPNPVGQSDCASNRGVSSTPIVAASDWQGLVLAFQPFPDSLDSPHNPSEESNMSGEEAERISRLLHATSLALSAQIASASRDEVIVDVQVENLGPQRSGDTLLSIDLPAGINLADSSVYCRQIVPRRILCWLRQTAVGDLMAFSLTLDTANADSCDLDLSVHNTLDLTGQSEQSLALACNRPPTAAICEDDILAECTAPITDVELDGTCSSDPETSSAALLYAWSSATGTIEPATSATPTGSFAIGTHSVELVVTDEGGLSSEPDEGLVEIVDTTPPLVAVVGDSEMTLECAVDTYEELGAVATDLCDPNVPVSIGGDNVDTFTPATYIVEYSAEDDSGNTELDERIVEVKDTIPPTLSVTLSPNVLWPPNHSMVAISANIVADDLCDPAPVVTLVSAVSSEPDNATGNGDGDTTNDIQIIGGVVWLRAERAGGGPGRTYTLTYRATDASGNFTTAVATVNVPANG